MGLIYILKDLTISEQKIILLVYSKMCKSIVFRRCMQKKVISVLDFGSSKITVYAGHRIVNDNIKILASGESQYEGFINGEFLEPNAISSSIMEAISQVEEQLLSKIDMLYVGVPAEFCYVTTTKETKYFEKPTKITTKILDNIFLKLNKDEFHDTHTIINKAPLYFELDDGYKTLEVVGTYTSRLDTYMSVVMVENQFIHLISSILRNIGIMNFDFVCNTMAESTYLIDEAERINGAILVDVGYITTSVAHVLGDGIKDLRSFSLGGGYITEDIARILELDYNVAEEFKRHAIITLKPDSPEDTYDISYENEDYSEPIISVNEIIKNKIDKICHMVKKCINTFENLPQNYVIYFTGGGLNYIDGIKDYLSKDFNEKISLIAPKAMIYNKPDLSSVISLLNTAIKIDK